MGINFSIHLSYRARKECMCSCNTSEDSFTFLFLFFSFVTELRGVIEAIQDKRKLNFVLWNNACGFQCGSRSSNMKSRKHKILIRLKEKQKN